MFGREKHMEVDRQTNQEKKRKEVGRIGERQNERGRQIREKEADTHTEKWGERDGEYKRNIWIFICYQKHRKTYRKFRL